MAPPHASPDIIYATYQAIWCGISHTLSFSAHVEPQNHFFHFLFFIFKRHGKTTYECRAITGERHTPTLCSTSNGSRLLSLDGGFLRSPLRSTYYPKFLSHFRSASIPNIIKVRGKTTFLVSCRVEHVLQIPFRNTIQQ